MSADSELLNSWCQGDQEAYAVLLARHHGLVRSACLRQAPPEAVDDCLQAVFLVLFRRPKAAAKAPSLVAWLLRVSSNVSHNARRAQVRRQVAEQAASAQSARQEADPSEALSHLDECLLLLPEPQRVAVSLQYLAGYSSNEVAATLGVSRNHAYKLVHRGLAGLRDLLARRQVVVGSTALLGLLGAQAQAAALPVSATTLISITTGTPSAGASALATGVIKTMTIAALSPFIAAAGLLLAIGTATVALSGEAPPVQSPAGAATAAATAPVPGVAQPLVVQPVELALVDGRSVAGGLVGQTDVYLFLYSPSGGTVASFEKRFVASYTLAKDPKKVVLNTARPLTAEEDHYWGWKGWPDAPPGADVGPATAKKPGAAPVPAYAKETWGPPKRLLIWAQPGSSGNFSKTENWLIYGEAPTGKVWWDDQTDVLLPSAPGNQYKLLPGEQPQLPEGRLNYVVRHIMVERNGLITSFGCAVHGNEWVHRGGSASTRFEHNWVGSRNTYARFDVLPVQPLGTSSLDVQFGVWGAKDAKHWRPESELAIAQYIGVIKEANASVELLGTFTSRDKFSSIKGITILGPDSNFSNDTRNGFMVDPGATLVLLDGALWGKRVDWTRGPCFHVHGNLQAGLPDRPLTRDATILVSTSDYGGHLNERDNGGSHQEGGGFVLYPKGTLRIFSSDPATARLVFRCSLSDRRSSMKLINVDLLGEAVLDGVVFMDLWKGGLRLGDLKQKEAWKHVSFVDCQSQKPEDLYAVYQKGTPPSGYTENPAMKALSMSGYQQPEPAVTNDAALDKLRQDLQAAEARSKELYRAFQAIVGDDDALSQAMATYGLAKVEEHQAKRALWLAFAERMKTDGGGQPAKP